MRGLAAPTFTDPTGTEDGYWEWTWTAAAPGDLRWHEPLAHVEVRTADGGWAPAHDGAAPVDDQGYHVGVVHLGAGRGGAHRYAARWYTPYLGPSPAHRVRRPRRRRPTRSPDRSPLCACLAISLELSEFRSATPRKTSSNA